MFGETYLESEAGKNFYRIGEVSRLTDTKPFVLRYWETEFPMLQPVKSASGHRLYRREDVETVLRIKRLLYDEGFTIAGARRHLREEGGVPLDAAEVVPLAENRPVGENGSAEHAGTQGVLIAHEESPVAPLAPRHRAEPVPTIGRNVLLELRDSLRAFLTLLESE